MDRAASGRLDVGTVADLVLTVRTDARDRRRLAGEHRAYRSVTNAPQFWHSGIVLLTTIWPATGYNCVGIGIIKRESGVVKDRRGSFDASPTETSCDDTVRGPVGTR